MATTLFHLTGADLMECPSVQNRGTRHWFPYAALAPITDVGPTPEGATHVIYLGQGAALSGWPFRFARVLRTVAYIATDEAEDGSPVWERWGIRR